MLVFDCSSSARSLIFFALLGAFLLCFLPSGATAQTGATIRIVAQDEALQPGAGGGGPVKLQGACVAAAVTDEAGAAAFPRVAPGTYDIEVAKEGFETRLQSAVAVTAGAPLEIKFTLVPK